jgi:hypothetical protein
MSKESTPAGVTPSRPDWDKLQLTDEYQAELKQLQDDRAKLRRVSAAGLAFITFMDSPLYADTYGVALQDAFWQLCNQDVD